MYISSGSLMSARSSPITSWESEREGCWHDKRIATELSKINQLKTDTRYGFERFSYLSTMLAESLPHNWANGEGAGSCASRVVPGTYSRLVVGWHAHDAWLYSMGSLVRTPLFCWAGLVTTLVWLEPCQYALGIGQASHQRIECWFTLLSGYCTVLYVPCQNGSLCGSSTCTRLT